MERGMDGSSAANSPYGSANYSNRQVLFEHFRAHLQGRRRLTLKYIPHGSLQLMASPWRLSGIFLVPGCSVVPAWAAGASPGREQPGVLCERPVWSQSKTRPRTRSGQAWLGSGH